MKLKSFLNVNLFGLLLLLVAFIISLGMIISRSYEEGNLGNQASGKRVVQIMHWQLEPGYRQAMQNVIDDYNALPHVKEARIEVRQLDVTERVYAQVLNVHAVSGTAPDLCEKGMSALVGGAGIAQFFDALGEVGSHPNPYNNPQTLPDDLAPELAKLLKNQPWRETLIDGMQGGWVTQLQEYYAVPTSFFGAVKIYYNKELFKQAKQILRDAIDAPTTPAWYADLFLTGAGDELSGFVTDTPELRAWVRSDDEPQTLGRMLMICRAIRQIAAESGQSQLVPIAGSSYTDQLFAQQYMLAFTSGYATALNTDHDASVSGPETWMGLQAGTWSFDDPQIAAFFECVRTICDQFPAGFLGLDREQARRRFVNEQAGMIATGSWDAKSLFDATLGTPVTEDDPAMPYETVTTIDGLAIKNHKFDVGIMDFPLPGPGERWNQYTTYPPSDAQANGGAGFMVYQRSTNKEWAIDFLHYLTSFAVNQRFNREAGWLPIVVGTTPTPNLLPFTPDPNGLAPSDSMIFSGDATGNLGTRFIGEFKNFLAGDLDYEPFVETIRQVAQDPRTGIDRVVYDEWLKLRDRVRSVESLITVEAANQLLRDDQNATRKLNSSIRQSALMHNSTSALHQWQKVFPDKPFPEF